MPAAQLRVSNHELVCMAFNKGALNILDSLPYHPSLITVEQIKNVKISPKIENADKFAKGLSVSVIPKTIDLSGNKEVLDAVALVETMPVTLGKQMQKGDEIEVKLQLPVGTKLKANVENTVKIVFN